MRLRSVLAVLTAGLATVPLNGCMTAYYLMTTPEDRACWPDAVCGPGQREQIEQMTAKLAAECERQKAAGEPLMSCERAPR